MALFSIIRLTFILICLISIFFGNSLASSSSSSSTRDVSSLSVPVRNFEPSWAASCAQGTAVALKVNHDSVLIFIRSPASNLWRPSHSSFSATPEEMDGLKVKPIQPMTTAAATSQFAPSWLPIGGANNNYSVCAMTGLASDVEHLCRVLQKQVDAHWNIFDQPLTTHSMTLGLAECYYQKAASSGSSRPFGVQCLLVGGDDHDQKTVFGVYTIDPSGAWQSWGGTTAIGKYAKSVREELAQKRRTKLKASSGSTSTTTSSSLKEALEQIVDCWMETCKKQNIQFQSNEDYQVLVIRKKQGESSCKVYVVEDDDVQAIVDQAVAAANTETK